MPLVGVSAAPSETNGLVQDIFQLGQGLKYRTFIWDPDRSLQEIGLSTEGILLYTPIEDKSLKSHINLLNYIRRMHKENPNEKMLFILSDFNLLYDPQFNDITLVETMKNLTAEIKQFSGKKRLVVLGTSVDVPKHLEGIMDVIHHHLPTKAELEAYIQKLKAGMAKPNSLFKWCLTEAEEKKLLTICLGLTREEIERYTRVASNSLTSKDFNSAALAIAKDLKKEKLKRMHLELIDPGDMEASGLDLLMKWVETRGKPLFDEATRNEHRLGVPQGLLLVGPPGSGKSFSVKTIATKLGVPILKLDVGKLFGSLVGQSEQNLRSILQMAESISPCVLWLDEIEKGFGGATGPSGDSGTTQRVFATFLTWLQEKEHPVFVVATANDVTALPPEFLRSGRFNATFYLGLPNTRDRKAILKTHLEYRRAILSDEDLQQAAAATKGFSAAELQNAVMETITECVVVNKTSVTLAVLLEELGHVRPQSKSHAKKFADLDAWAKDHARPASSEDPADKLVPSSDVTVSGFFNDGIE